MFLAEVPEEIAHINVAYMLLAQRLLRHDRAGGMLRLGIDAEAADFILGLAPAQVLRMSSSNALLCSLRTGEMVRTVFASGHPEPQQQAHLFIVLAGEHGDARARPGTECTP